jgi:hypothetical protein
MAPGMRRRDLDARYGTEMRQGEAIKWGIILKSTLSYRHRLVSTSGIQGDFESWTDILIMSYWLHVELGKVYLKNSLSKNKMTFIFSATIFFNCF